jgi:hypothetical protein
MSRPPFFILAVAGVSASLSAAGCGSRTVPVKGVVTFDSRPLANASVIFIPMEPGGRDASGSTDANGAFQLSTFRPGDGALPGLYKVTVHYSEPVAVPAGLKTAEEVQKAMVKASASHKPSFVIPPTYSRPDQTILRHRVPDDGDAKLVLKSAKP